MDQKLQVNFANFCTANNQMIFYTYISTWVNEWGSEWLDVGRKSRYGIFNTNNPSESFFKTLLRGFLKGVTSFSPAEVLNIIVNDMIPVLQYKQSFHNDISKNPSFKQLASHQKHYEEVEAKGLIIEIDRNLFSVEYKGEIHKVVHANGRSACSCNHWLWDGKCFHCFAISKIHESDSGFFFEYLDSDDEAAELSSLEESSEDSIGTAPDELRCMYFSFLIQN